MTDFSDTELQDIDPSEYLRKLSLDDFIACEKTRNILIDEHYNKLEYYLEEKLINIYESYNKQYQDASCLFKHDLYAIDSHAFASMIYNFISIKYDLELFYECPQLAKDLLPK